jgi:DNA-directed RNA polymerase I and III subunit RPAC2
MSVYEKTFTLKDEDHTMGNAVRYMLNKNPQVHTAQWGVGCRV